MFASVVLLGDDRGEAFEGPQPTSSVSVFITLTGALLVTDVRYSHSNISYFATFRDVALDCLFI